MSPSTLTLLVAIGAIAFFGLAMSLTLIFKGHNIDSEIGDNKHMRARGIKCAAHQIKVEEAALRGESPDLAATDCPSGGCCSCGEVDCQTKS